MLGIPDDRNALCVGGHLLQQLHSLGCHFVRDECDAGKILAGPSEGPGEFRAYRIVTDTANDRDAAFARVEDRLHDVAANREQQIGPLRDQFLGQFWKARRDSVGITERDVDRAAVDETTLRERVLQCLIYGSERRAAEHEPANTEATSLCGG